MSNDYISTEVSKILKDATIEHPKNVAMAAAWIMGNYKALNLKIYDCSKSSSLTDFYILASTTNSTQTQSMAEEISHQLKNNGIEARSKEGVGTSEWALIDFGDIIVHIFQDSARDIYDLDHLWRNLPQVNIPNEYYFSTTTEKPSKKASTEGYF
jgi:ribosome-associated protein